jgi:hypothetical protein
LFIVSATGSGVEVAVIILAGVGATTRPGAAARHFATAPVEGGALAAIAFAFSILGCHQPLLLGPKTEHPWNGFQAAARLGTTGPVGRYRREGDVMSNLAGALIGAAIDRRDGDSGIKGAIIGSVAESALRIAAPIVVTYALGWAVQFGVRKAWQTVRGRDPIDGNGDLRVAGA